MELKQLQLPEIGEEYALMHTSMGDIAIRLFPEAAPKTVKNFIELSKTGYYDNTVFHRIINDFMIQGGDPTATGMGGSSIYGDKFEDEFHLEYRNLKGALSMANAGPNTNGSQFFIVQNGDIEEDILEQMKKAGPENGYLDEVVEAYKNNGGTFWLDFKHTVFGHVFKGLDIVDAIAAVKVGPNDKPVEDVVIKNIEIIEYK